MPDAFYEAIYLVETPLPLEAVAEVMAGEQSCGTFTRVEGETDELRERARADVVAIRDLGEVAQPSLRSSWLDRKSLSASPHLGEVVVRFPVANVGVNLSTLAATVAGNLFDLGEVTGLRLQSLKLPGTYRKQYPLPQHGIDGTRRLTGVAHGALIGSIIKPNVGLRSEEIASLVERLCSAGLDFIKDDEIASNPTHAPLSTRVPAVMAAVRRHQDRTGKHVMVAFNITDETDAMRRHADLVAKEGGSCVMASLNWCGFSGIETLRRSSDLVVHGHRNGYGALSRHPALGIGFQAYQTLWRLAGVDHMHVHGLGGKFAQADEEVVESAKDCLESLCDVDDRVMPAFSSGQWAGTVEQTYRAVNTSDLLFMAGGGVMAHPGGPAEGVASIREAWRAVEAGESIDSARARHRSLSDAFSFFGKP
ncbi:ribulose-bisphosphate carboxylase large subunit family protein [Microvirga arabica]|uniref:ribulose-bisphosphate carboxylase large subunit family protein n=1 Tax=Microvirga arabica TaxID=1128671 RepID=UPI001939EA8B|nr:ribulose-bisphosphate carboxylase large subunit family protein [Microvirga arabica]MBM1170339.1 ribulose-bisphosphate carboxylase large subunit family protein [Microvirga arabica]